MKRSTALSLPLLLVLFDQSDNTVLKKLSLLTLICKLRVETALHSKSEHSSSSSILWTSLKMLATNKYSSLFGHKVREKSFITLTPVPKVIKLFTAIIYECSQ